VSLRSAVHLRHSGGGREPADRGGSGTAVFRAPLRLPGRRRGSTLGEVGRRMKRFYLLLGVVAVVAIGFLYYSANQQAGPAPGARGATAPVTAQDSAFPGYLLGSDSAPVKVVEFVDYECPICAMFATVQFPTIRDQLIKTGKVQWRLRDYPLPPTTHRWSHLAADAVACASEQGKAWEMVDALFNTHDWALQSSNP